MNVRLDKWLVAARFYKKRELAKTAIESGKIRYNDQRAKPSRSVEIGVTLSIKKSIYTTAVIVKAITEIRRSAKEAQALYEETPKSQSHNAAIKAARKQAPPMIKPLTKPTKGERKKLIAIKKSY